MLPSAGVFEVRTLDISLGGMAVIAEANPPVGSTMTLRIPLPAKPRGVFHIEVRGQVMNSFLALHEGGFKIGLRFVGLDATATAAIGQYLR